MCVRVCVRVLLLKASSCRARQFMSGVPWAEISVQIRKTSKELVVQRGAQQRPQGRSKTACTSPPPPTSVLVDFKNACAPNSSATTQHNMRSLRRLHEQPRKTALDAITHDKTLTVPEALFRRESLPVSMHGCIESMTINLHPFHNFNKTKCQVSGNGLYVYLLRR